MEYKIAEIFHSIQTEGPFAGTPAFFIRMSGCNLSCSFCDTDHSQVTTLSGQELLKEAQKTVSNLVVITGGEPFLQDIGRLVRLLQYNNYIVQIETNGSVEPQEPCEWLESAVVVCSPKAGVTPGLWPFINSIKLLVVENTKINQIQDLIETCRDFGIEIFLQPQMGDNQDNNIARCFELCKALNLSMSVQWHKYLNIP